jgi:hypothetical protein
LRFNVQGLNGPVSRATLRLRASTSQSLGIKVHGVSDNTWAEFTINYSNAPAVGTVLGSSGPISANTWKTIDVTPFIAGNGSFNLALTTDSSTAISLASRESGANAPQLIIETGSGPVATASHTPTRTATASPTATSFATATFTSTASSTATYTPTGTTTFTPTATSASGTFTFSPSADAYVNESNPSTNYGTSTTLRADATPVVRSYLRFDVQGLSGTIARVTLRIFTNSSSSTGYEVRNVTDNSWGETTINYSNAPATDGVTGTSGPFSAGVWTTVDVTPLLTGNGTYNIALTTTNATAFSLASRESGANAPQLIIETAP